MDTNEIPRELLYLFPGPKLTDEMRVNLNDEIRAYVSPEAFPFWATMHLQNEKRQTLKDLRSGVDLIEKHGENGSRERVLAAYYSSENPLQKYGFNFWIDAFSKVGCEPKQPNPERPMLLFRGADQRHPHGLSWTPFYELALAFAVYTKQPAVFYTWTTVPEVIHVRTSERYPLMPLEVIYDSRRGEVHQYPTPQKFFDLLREAIADEPSDNSSK